MKKKKPNKKIIFYSLIAFASLFLSVTVHWLFLIGAAVMLWLNQKELYKKN